MDIIAHGLWAGAAYKAFRKRQQKQAITKKQFWLSFFWGMFPDLFAFSIPFIAMFWSLTFGQLHFSDFPRPDAGEPPPTDRFWFFRIAPLLYQFSHSFIVFGVIALLLWLVFRRIPLVIIGWPLHILFDIPTHSYRFYPTPFLWPISDWRFLHGFSWGVPWFMILNYSALIFVYFWLRDPMQKLWFKAKTYGWGWYPVTWQGWGVLLGYIGLVFFNFWRIDSASHSVSDTLINFIPDTLLITFVLLWICYRTGERPRWRWGENT